MLSLMPMPVTKKSVFNGRTILQQYIPNGAKGNHRGLIRNINPEIWLQRPTETIRNHK
jgi:hypothetical protein